jgi:hypothetical protein
VSGGFERGGLHENDVLERPAGRLDTRVDPVPNRPALHRDDRMVAVLARNRRRQPKHESSLGLPDDGFKAVGGDMMAFIDDQVPFLIRLWMTATSIPPFARARPRVRVLYATSGSAAPQGIPQRRSRVSGTRASAW